MADMPTVLFVCVHNAGRSQMAAGYLQHLAGGPDRGALGRVRAEGSDQPVAVAAMAEEGIDIASNAPEAPHSRGGAGVGCGDHNGCGDACPIFPGKRYEDWVLDDPAGQDEATVRRIRDEIRARVETLIGELLPRGECGMNAQGGLQSADAVLHRAAERLAQQFTGMVGEETVERVVFESYTTLGRTATVTSLLPTLAEKFVHDRLVALAQSRGQVAKTVPEILYVCVQNSGRSQMAAAITRQLAGDRVHIRSAGSQPAADLLPGVVTVLTEAGGIDLTGEFPKPLTDDVVRAADAVVTMGCGGRLPALSRQALPGLHLTDRKGSTWTGSAPSATRSKSTSSSCSPNSCRRRAPPHDRPPYPCPSGPGLVPRHRPAGDHRGRVRDRGAAPVRRCRAAAAGELDSDGVRSRGADPAARPGLRRALQPRCLRHRRAPRPPHRHRPPPSGTWSSTWPRRCSAGSVGGRCSRT